MKITEISVKLGITHNLGDYSNIRPEICLKAEVEPGENAGEVIDKLFAAATAHIGDIVDTELERREQEPVYYLGVKYTVSLSDLRQVVALHPADVQMPRESNWKHQDRWFQSHHGYPARMRYRTAGECLAYVAASRSGYQVVETGGSLVGIPPLPDAGPEPAWHQKGLGTYLGYLDIPEKYWEEVGQMEGVDSDYLRRLWNARRGERGLDMLGLIRQGWQPTQQAQEVPPFEDYEEDDYEEIDEEDYEE